MVVSKSVAETVKVFPCIENKKLSRIGIFVLVLNTPEIR